MQDLAFLRCDIRDLSRKQGQEARISINYERERDFVFLWGRDGGFARQTEKDTGCQFFNGLVN